jgi:hypothetical protein
MLLSRSGSSRFAEEREALVHRHALRQIGELLFGHSVSTFVLEYLPTRKRILLRKYSAYRTTACGCLIAFLALAASPARGGNIFEVKYQNQADVKIFRVEYENQADLCVYVAEYANQAKGEDAIWHYVEYANQADAKIFFVEYANQADLKVYFVKYQNQAKWKKSNKFRGMFK